MVSLTSEILLKFLDFLWSHCHVPSVLLLPGNVWVLPLVLPLVFSSGPGVLPGSSSASKRHIFTTDLLPFFSLVNKSTYRFTFVSLNLFFDLRKPSSGSKHCICLAKMTQRVFPIVPFCSTTGDFAREFSLHKMNKDSAFDETQNVFNKR